MEQLRELWLSVTHFCAKIFKQLQCMTPKCNTFYRYFDFTKALHLTALFYDTKIVNCYKNKTFSQSVTLFSKKLIRKHIHEKNVY